MTIERVLARLVHSRDARRRWREGTLDISPADAADLATLDPLAIEATATAVGRHVLERTHTGVGTIVDAFPHTIAAWRAREPSDHDLDELAAAFLDSTAAVDWRETPGHTGGISLEEAFYRFASAEQLGDANERTREWLTTMIRMLAIDGDAPTYSVPACITQRAGAVWALDDRDPPTLYAAVGGRIMIGPVTTLVADLLRGEDPADAGAKRGVSADAARSLQRELHAMLWPKPEMLC